MSVSTKHPQYSLFVSDWNKMTDSYDGEGAIKGKGPLYLPQTTGQKLDGAASNPESDGAQMYEAYKMRAVYHDFVKEAVEKAVGVMHAKPPLIELPESMEFLRDRATVFGEGLEQLLRRINEAQLVNGRFGMLLDLPVQSTNDGQDLYIATYSAQSIINWDNGRREEITGQTLNLVVLDESEYERDSGTFEWTQKEKYRVLVIGDVVENETKGTYSVGLLDETTTELTESQLEQPNIRGNTLQAIPFVFVNAQDILPQPDKPPLLGLANLSLAIYRGEADYRQSLFMQGQDTLVVKGLPKEEDGSSGGLRTGAGAVIHLPIDGGAEFVGVDSTGLSEQRQSLENDKNAAQMKSGQLINAMSRERESGDALRIRSAGQTASLRQIAKTGAGALQTLLRLGATWLGADPEKVIVEPNLDFTDEDFDGKSFKDIMEAKAMGLPLSNQSIHARLQDRGYTELEFEEEMAEIEKEDIPPAGTIEGDNPDDTGSDEDDEEAGTEDE